MTATELDLGRYKLGWSDAEDYVFKPKRGLSTDIVNETIDTLQEALSEEVLLASLVILFFLLHLRTTATVLGPPTVPVPSWPWRLLPQHHTVPSVRSAHE